MNWIKASDRLPVMPKDMSHRYLVITTHGAMFGNFYESKNWYSDEGIWIRVHYWLEQPEC